LARVLIEFPHRPGGHCSSTALRDMLSFYGHELTEEMVFGIGVGLGFVYYKNADMNPPIYVGGRIYNLEEHFTKHLGIDMEVVSGIDEERGWLEVKAMIDSGIPVMVHADVYYLDYLRAKVHFSGHRIVIVGYDEEKEIAYVADNDRDQIQECSIESLRKARSARFLPQPADNTYYRFRVPENLKPLREAIIQALVKVVKYNLRLPAEKTITSHDGALMVRGIEGVRFLAENMNCWLDEFEKEKVVLLCKNIYVTAEKGGTGYGGNFRRIYGRFLREASNVLPEKRLEDIGNHFISIGNEWTKMCMIFKEFSNEPEKAIELAAPIASKIYADERSALESVETVLTQFGV